MQKLCCDPKISLRINSRLLFSKGKLHRCEGKRKFCRKFVTLKLSLHHVQWKILKIIPDRQFHRSSSSNSHPNRVRKGEKHAIPLQLKKEDGSEGSKGSLTERNTPLSSLNRRCSESNGRWIRTGEIFFIVKSSNAQKNTLFISLPFIASIPSRFTPSLFFPPTIFPLFFPPLRDKVVPRFRRSRIDRKTHTWTHPVPGTKIIFASSSFCLWKKKK